LLNYALQTPDTASLAGHFASGAEIHFAKFIRSEKQLLLRRSVNASSAPPASESIPEEKFTELSAVMARSWRAQLEEQKASVLLIKPHALIHGTRKFLMKSK
jgi:hypothetical protein